MELHIFKDTKLVLAVHHITTLTLDNSHVIFISTCIKDRTDAQVFSDDWDSFTCEKEE